MLTQSVRLISGRLLRRVQCKGSPYISQVAPSRNVRADESGESQADAMATPALPAADFMALSWVASGRLRRSARSR